MIQFWETRAGQQFFEATMPKIAKALESLNLSEGPVARALIGIHDTLGNIEEALALQKARSYAKVETEILVLTSDDYPEEMTKERNKAGWRCVGVCFSGIEGDVMLVWERLAPTDKKPSP